MWAALALAALGDGVLGTYRVHRCAVVTSHSQHRAPPYLCVPY